MRRYALGAWAIVFAWTITPSASFAQIVEGPAVEWRHSNWGKRRANTEGIEKIAVDYFGQSAPAYELGEKYIPWRSARGPYQGWLAVSATILMVAQARWAPELEHRVEDSYQWLMDKEPVAKIGYSIFVFDLRTGS